MTEVKKIENPDPLFERCCRAAGLAPTQRQWRKWNKGKGKAREYIHAQELNITEEMQEKA
jgi:hypothetical protein